MRDTVLVVDDEPDVIDLVRYQSAPGRIRGPYRLDGSFRDVGRQRIKARRHRTRYHTSAKMTGVGMCKALRTGMQTSTIPILFLTAKADPAERIAGLELGIDDNITKPFSPRELVLRVQNVLRRLRSVQNPSLLTVDEFCLDKGNFEISLNGRRLQLTTTEFKLLALLLERRGKTVSRETLLQDVWGYENAIDTRTADTHVWRLREKLGPTANRIATVRGEGYRFLISRML